MAEQNNRTFFAFIKNKKDRCVQKFLIHQILASICKDKLLNIAIKSFMAGCVKKKKKKDASSDFHCDIFQKLLTSYQVADYQRVDNVTNVLLHRPSKGSNKLWDIPVWS